MIGGTAHQLKVCTPIIFVFMGEELREHLRKKQTHSVVVYRYTVGDQKTTETQEKNDFRPPRRAVHNTYTSGWLAEKIHTKMVVNTVLSVHRGNQKSEAEDISSSTAITPPSNTHGERGRGAASQARGRQQKKKNTGPFIKAQAMQNRTY